MDEILAMAEHIAESRAGRSPMTAEELLEVEIPGKWAELVRGQLRISEPPGIMRAPDVAFLSGNRLSVVRARGYGAGAPDLAVEVLSPSDSAAEVLERIADWLRAGVRLVWVVDVERRHARVHRPDGSITLIPQEGSFDGEDVLPGFTCAIADLLK
jgi:Uma2 family endonuclease